MMYQLAPTALRMFFDDDDFFQPMHRRKTSKAPVIEPNYSYRSNSDAGMLRIDLPGVAKDNVEICVDDGKMTVTGKRYRMDDDQMPFKKLKVDDEKQNKDSQGVEVEVVAEEKVDKVDNGEKDDVQQDKPTVEEGNTTAAAEQKTAEHKDEDERKDTERKDSEQSDGEKHAKEDEKEAQKQKLENIYKTTFRVHRKVDVDNIAVQSMRDGVLSVRMPFRKDLVRRITVQ